MDRKALEQREGELEAKGQLSQAETKELEEIKAKLAAMDDEDEDPPVSVTARIPESTWGAVSRVAKQGKRSRNSIINEALQKYLSQPENGGTDEVRDLSALLQVLPEGDSEIRSAVRAKLTECLAKRHGIAIPEPEPPQPKRGKGKKGEPEPEPKPYDPERDGERRKTNERRNPWDMLFGMKGKPPKGTDGKRLAERRTSQRRGKAVIQ